ncbi:pyruvate formate-lyase-activating protein [Desulforamulus putei]|uniref:Pyruvate formate-lyase-activating enzyme n=1 Tax=Desulforamulus putei DSM 12395 TaxID=1121429 RepID=A0A1M4YZ67_9FIRM|nr:pyruvate formate-lyase-activating protein [Desulforamulus putei]SHF11104.1 pyruvate formate lyase activating enzyme [Desulforamulus putei DSM 12395]
MVSGRIHSIESCGTVDGPGLRCVIFLQGCPLRCRYCHNPDTWQTTGGQEVEASALIKMVLRFKPYFNDRGGVTLSGGEPLLQPEFAAAILQGCKEAGIHTAVDTSGWVDPAALARALPYTDLLLLDVKAVQDDQYRWLTGRHEHRFLAALDYIKKEKTPIWVRYVVLPGINDSAQHIQKLKELMSSLGSQVEKVELLPYHPLGIHKWNRLGLTYTLEHLQPPSRSSLEVMARALQQNQTNIVA